MIPLCSIFITFCLAASFTVSFSAGANRPEIIEITAKPRTYSMKIREFHECVSCHDNNQVRKDYDACLKHLSTDNLKVIKSCCKPTFGKDFCDKGADGKIGYATICKDPKKALDVGRCFWNKTANKNSADIEKYRKCKRQILDRYCTTSSFE